MKKAKPDKKRTRADYHLAFIRLARKIFRFLVDDFGFKASRIPPKEEAGGREIWFGYWKANQVGVPLYCEGIFAGVLLQDCRNDSLSQRGLHRLMKLRCPNLMIPAIYDESDQTIMLEFCAKVLREHFKDFLEGDASIIHTPLPKEKKSAMDLWKASQKAEKRERPLKEEVKQWLAWNNGAILGLARSIRTEGRKDEFPILADALEEAGCKNKVLLKACRSGIPEVDGNWALRVLLDVE